MPIYNLILAAILIYPLFTYISTEAQCPQSNVTGSLKFNKRTHDQDYFVVSRLGEIFCCVDGYESLLWYKNNKPLIANIHINFLNGNQTVRFKTTSLLDEGVYRCVANKGDNQINHTVQWSGKIIPGIDKTAVRCTKCPQEVIYRHLGDSILLTCEVYFGFKSYHFKPIVTWGKVGITRRMLMKIVNITRRFSEKSDKQKANLYIDSLKEHHFGEYECQPSFYGDNSLKRYTIKLYMGDDPLTSEFKQIKVTSFSTGGVLLVVIFVVAMILTLFRLDIQVCLHNRYGSLEINDGKDIDVLISYAEEDEDFVIETLQYHLENNFHFTCLLQGKNTILGENILDNSAESLQRSRRCAIVLSPSYLNNGFLTYIFKCALHKMLQNNIHFFFIIYKDISLNSNENDEFGLKNSIHIIKKIRWSDNNKNQINTFWKNIILQLPPKRN